MIGPEDVTLKRLKSNDVNFSVGYNAINVFVGNDPKGPAKINAFKKCGNIYPTWELEEFILSKSRYMKACMQAGVPMAPTIFSYKNKRNPAKLLQEIKERGWQKFVLKQSESGFSLGFLKLTVEECEKDSGILKNYFKDYANCPEFIVQEAIDGFTRNWETRCFWFNGEFLYAIANMAAVSTEDGAERIISGDDIPKEFLENAKKIGQEAIKALPQMKAPNGQPLDMILMRTDIGCSDSPIHDKHTNWDPNGKTFFLNEIEPSSTTWFVRHLKFDCMPMYGKLYADMARAIHAKMSEGPVKPAKAIRSIAKEEPKAKRARTGKAAVAKKPAGNTAAMKKPAGARSK